MTTGEDRARRRREAERERLIERLNAEVQPLGIEEIEERERAERTARRGDGVWLCLAVCSLWPVAFSFFAMGAEVYKFLPGPAALWAGALSVHFAFRRLGWGRPVARLIFAASLIEAVGMFIGWRLLEGSLSFDPLAPVTIAYAISLQFLIGAGVIAGTRARRIPDGQR